MTATLAFRCPNCERSWVRHVADGEQLSTDRCPNCGAPSRQVKDGGGVTLPHKPAAPPPARRGRR